MNLFSHLKAFSIGASPKREATGPAGRLMTFYGQIGNTSSRTSCDVIRAAKEFKKKKGKKKEEEEEEKRFMLNTNRTRLDCQSVLMAVLSLW